MGEKELKKRKNYNDSTPYASLCDYYDLEVLISVLSWKQLLEGLGDGSGMGSFCDLFFSAHG